MKLKKNGQYFFLVQLLLAASMIGWQLPAYSFPFLGDQGGFTGTLEDYLNDFLEGNYLNLIKKGKDCCIKIFGGAELVPPVEPPPPAPPPLEPPLDGPLIPIPPSPPDPGFALGIGPLVFIPEDPDELPDIGIALILTVKFSPLVSEIFIIDDETTTLINGQFEILDFLDGERGGVINFVTGEGFFGDETFSQDEGLDLNGRSFSVNNVQQHQANCRVPEPTSTLSLLTLGTLGAASTLKRKLKPSKTAEKDTTKVG